MIKVNVSKKKKKTQKRRGNQNPAPKASELTRLGAALRNLGKYGGAAVGGMFGMPAAGSSVGTDLGAALSRWLGSGDYTVGSNSIVQRAMKGSDSVPAMHNSGQSVIIRHREYIGEIRGSTTFAIQDEFQLNPGNDRTFPWLSLVANGFQEYRIKGMVFHYVPTSGSAISGTNAALGSVMLSTSYRANDSPPTSKVEMLNEYFATESVPSEPFCHPIECDPKENPFNVQYVRQGELPNNDSLLLYDLGTTYVAVTGQQATGNVLGDLWCTYEVELKKPIVASNVTNRYKVAAIEYTGTITGSDWFNGTSIDAGNLGISAAGRVLTFPEGSVGTWYITVCMTPVTTFSAVDLSGGATLTNCTSAYLSRTNTYIRTVLGGAGGTLNRAWYQLAITISDPAVSATVTFPSGTLTGTCNTSNIWVSHGTALGP